MTIQLEQVFNVGLPEPYHFLVLGCGGTGSMYIPRLAAYIKTSTNVGNSITIADFDIVETKNLVRQNFARNDVGKNKAEVLASKCNTVYDTNISAYPNFVETHEDLKRLLSRNQQGTQVIVGCVDTNAVRKMIHEFITLAENPIIWLDSGNDEYNGQVCLGISGCKRKSVETGDDGYPVLRINLPDVTYYFPDMLLPSTKFASELSCAEHAVSNPQAAITNQTAANLLMQFSTSIVTRKIKASLVTFDAQTMIFSTKRITESLLKQVGNPIPGSLLSKYQIYTDAINAKNTVEDKIKTLFNNEEPETLRTTEDNYISLDYQGSVGFQETLPGQLLAEQPTEI